MEPLNWTPVTTLGNNTIYEGTTSDGTKVAAIYPTDRGRYAASVHHVPATPRHGCTTFDGAVAVVEATLKDHR